jgi:hypothetical protein
LHGQAGRRKIIATDGKETKRRRECRFGENIQSGSDGSETATGFLMRKLDMRRLLQLVLCGTVVLGLASAAFAETVNFDIGDGSTTWNYTGTAVAPDAGTHWTPYRMGWGDSGYAPVVASDGTPSSVYVAIAGGGYASYWNYDGTGIAPNLMGSYAYSGDGSGWTVEIDHLTPGGKYDMYWYQQNGIAAGTTGSFTFGGHTETATNNGQTSAFILNNNYVVFSGATAVTADSNGSIFGSISNTASICGFQIMSSPAPEPGTLVLLGTGVLGLLAYAWRKRR